MSSEYDVIKFELDPAKFLKHDGNCWKVKIPEAVLPTVKICHNMNYITIPCYIPNNLSKYFDNEQNPTQSCAVLYENDVGIENKHSKIEDIINVGNGRYIFWENTLYFSSTDNSLVNANGKKYHVVIFSKNDINDDNFTFGNNWIDYVTYAVNDQVVTEAGKHIDDWLNKNDDLKDKTIIDVGCGSGLSSLCFIKRNAKSVVSFDVDPNCVIATKILASKFYPKIPDNWKMMVGSILDDNLVEKLGQFDVVYSWGVLHHTGAMWKAVDNCIKLVKPGGLMLISLYSGIKNYTRDKLMKQTYNKANKYGKMNFIADYVMLIRKAKKDVGEDPEKWNSLQNVRGMRKYNDIVDWLGGLPYEVTDTDTIVQICNSYGLKLLRVHDPPAKACHEWLFQKE